MYLEKLEIQGFKSFANPVTLVFNRELTAIVGPNGSGKSNIADAVRWVLGEQSVKTLRGKKSEDVIFAGSDKKNRLGFAQASLYLNNLDHLADVDYEQIVITRKVERSGESEYLINNNKVRLLDVQLLLAKANFGQKTYSVIGQGMIDSILVSSAQERKEFFDEATGVKQFQIKKNQAINKVEGAKANLEQTNKILAELEPRLRSLTRQVKRLEKREKIEAELKEQQTNYYSFLLGNLNHDLTIKRSDFAKVQKVVAGLNQKLVELQTELEKEERSSSRQNDFEMLQKKLTQAQSEINSLLKEKTILEGRADLQLVSAGKSDIVWLKKRIETINNDISKNKLLLEEKNVQAKSAKEELLILEKKRDSILGDFKVLEDRLMGKDELSSEEIVSKLEHIVKSQRHFQEVLDKVSSLEALADLKGACNKVSQALGDLFEKLKTNKADNRLAWQKEFNQLLLSKDNLVAEISEARTKLALLENEVTKLREEIVRDEDELNKSRTEADISLNRSGDQKVFGEQLKDLQAKIQEKNQHLDKIREEIQEFNTKEEGKKLSLLQSQKVFRQVQTDFNENNNRLNEVKVELARLETREEELQREISAEFVDFRLVEVKHLDVDKSREEIVRLKNQLSMIGGIDELVMEEYQEVSSRYQFLKEQSDDLNEAIKHLEKIIKDLEEAISSQFDESFKNINKLFNDYFKKLFNGGKAELTLDIQEIRASVDKGNDDDDADDESEEEELEEKMIDQVVKRQYGIDIKATPPGKKLSSINMLSGGEKALTSIALVCAIIANNPSPFVVLDEVDAALDEANSIRFTQILEELSSKTQFVAITHNRATMHRAKIIYGVTMGDDGISRLLSMSFEQADEIAA